MLANLKTGLILSLVLLLSPMMALAAPDYYSTPPKPTPTPPAPICKTSIAVTTIPKPFTVTKPTTKIITKTITKPVTIVTSTLVVELVTETGATVSVGTTSEVSSKTVVSCTTPPATSKYGYY